ncbi:crossover junction endonuclease MUS81-like [Uloborus diversus]|uniref:crossover junction endonuclease MUS81-like n=1 Tax=Uloborus diversus TaxID=327109 RepID=UPI00240A63A2|nr:crossover junction endonuclease MUS81-like [Uloborus diversus]
MDARRKKKKYKCPNPLFEQWLTEWKAEAAEKGLKTQFTYAKALSSLRKYPLPLSSGKEAKILEYFGDKICSMLDAKLKEWKQGTQPASPKKGTQGSLQSSQESSSSSSTSLPDVPSKPKAATKNSVEVKVISKGRVFPAPKAVCERSSTESLDDGIDVADDTFFLLPGSFSVVLCVDNCETLSGQGRNRKLFLSELQKSGVEFEVRKLHVGDFLWVAREHSNTQRELVLDFIIERKRLDDFAHSIKDGRFREQKFRMRNSGLKNPIYLVEHYNVKYCGLPEATLEQALANTQIIDGFLIKRTQGVKESVSYLSLMTKLIKNKYQNQTLRSASKNLLKKKNVPNAFITFTEFNCSSMKNKSLTVKEMFAKHLLQFFGLSVDRAAAIVEHFPTPALFLEAYNNCETEEEQIQLVSSIKFGSFKKNIGPALSRAVHQFYTSSGSFS